MHLIQPHLHSRRAFLRRSSQLALTGTALPLALNLAAIGEAAAFNATDYKALVCVFLSGGDDYANTVVTYDNASYDNYAAIRGGVERTGGGIAIAKADLQATLLKPGVALPGGRRYALHPSMTELASLFNTGQAAVQLNVGPLVEPLTRAQYNAGTRRVPPGLFSHNDQQSVWQTSSPEGASVGWGGSLGDLAPSSNATSIFTCISVSGDGVFLTGESALAYKVGTDGAVKISAVNADVYGSSAVRTALAGLVQQPSGHVLENEYTRVTKRAMDTETVVTSALTSPMATRFPADNSLGDQLKMVARLIAGRNTLGARRQVFFVSLGGFDLHDYLIGGHPGLLGKVSSAMKAFHQATADLGLADKVTAFTASDFGRTLTSNGNGSDHGWGGHHFVVGGAVRGAAFYGTAPPVSIRNTTAAEDQWHVGEGRLLPSTSVDQYAATLARWFGVAESELAGVLPNLRNFGGVGYPTNLGFMG